MWRTEFQGPEQCGLSQSIESAPGRLCAKHERRLHDVLKANRGAGSYMKFDCRAFKFQLTPNKYGSSF